MAFALKTEIRGGKEYVRGLKSVNPKLNPKAKSQGLKKIGFEVARVSAKLHMVAGRSKTAPALPRKLTNRSYMSVGSIAVNLGRLPNEVQVGSHLKHMAVHERGGTVSFPAKSVRAHTRNKAFGRKVKPFTVPAHTVSGYTARFPRRAWLEPGVDEVVPRRAEQIMAAMWERQVKAKT